MPGSPPEQIRRAEKFKANATALRRRCTELKRELRETRRSAFAAGSASAFQDCYRAVGIGLNDALAVARGRKSLLDPIIEQMATERTNDLLERAGIRRQR